MTWIGKVLQLDYKGSCSLKFDFWSNFAKKRLFAVRKNIFEKENIRVKKQKFNEIP